VLTLVETTFGEDPADRAREALTNDLLKLAKRAQEYYRRTQADCGGGYSFVGLKADRVGINKLCFPSVVPATSNGTFTVMTSGTRSSVVLSGCGTFNGTNGSALLIIAYVFPDSIRLVNQN
jgi:hypothetical protein